MAKSVLRNARRRAGAVMALTLATTLGACAAFLPQTGPTKGDILDPDPNQTLEFAIAELDVAAVAATQPSEAPSFTIDFRGVGLESTGTVGVGDVLEVSIWENVEDGLFTSLNSKEAVIRQVLVDEQGFISMPYIGRLKAAGRSMVEIQAHIRKALEEQTLKPQIMVARTEAASRAVTVQGEVAKPGLYPIVLHQDRLLPMLAVAGGARGAPDLTEVTIRRGDAASSAWLDVVFDDPGANLALRSGDTIIVKEHERFFNAFGAVNRAGRQPLRRRDVSLLDAISQIGGIDGQAANPTGIFVFRREPLLVLDQLTRVDDPNEAPDALAQLAGEHAVVYQLELNRSEAMFLASEFAMRDGDTVYVTEAPYTAWRKVLSVIIPAVGTAGSVNSLVQTTQ